MISRAVSAESKKKYLAKRHLKEKRFRLYGKLAVSLALLFLCVLLLKIFSSGWSAFLRTEILVPVSFRAEQLELSSPVTEDDIQKASFYLTTKQSLYDLFPAVEDRTQRKDIIRLFTSNAEFFVRDYMIKHPGAIGETHNVWIPASSELDQLHKGHVRKEMSPQERLLSDQQVNFYEDLAKRDLIYAQLNTDFFFRGDSRSPELAGVGGALVGSFYTLLICFAISFPLGVAAAVYLEEFAPKNWFTEMIEVNINNLAAVPSIIFGLLGLAVIMQIFGVPRSTPLAGGIVLSLMTIPTIIIACRASLRAVPSSLREAALGLGASHMQVVFHQVLPLAIPGTLTGTIIGLAQALGETAPLLMIGMVAFIVDVPATPLEPAAALPTQIYLWAESAERGFIEKSSAAIIVILLFLGVMNFLAVLLRMKYQKSWQ